MEGSRKECATVALVLYLSVDGENTEKLLDEWTDRAGDVTAFNARATRLILAALRGLPEGDYEAVVDDAALAVAAFLCLDDGAQAFLRPAISALLDRYVPNAHQEPQEGAGADWEGFGVTEVDSDAA